MKVSPFILPAILAAAGPLAMADFTVSPVAVTLKPGEPFAFQVHPNDLKPRSWIISEGSGRNRAPSSRLMGNPAITSTSPPNWKHRKRWNSISRTRPAGLARP